MYKDVVTIFNRRGDFWWPTVIEGVHLVADEAGLAARLGWQRDVKAMVLVPYEKGCMVSGKQYVPPKIWREAALPEELITFQTGEEFDFFIEGAWEQGGPIEDDGLYDRLRRTRDGVYALSAVTRFRALPHFEIMGR